MKQIITPIFVAVVLFCLLGIAGCKKLSSYDYPAGAATPYVIITNDNNFSTFKIAIDRAGLAGLLNSNDAYTIFAPNNAAFTAAGYPVAIIQTMPVADLAVIVKNHILNGKVDVKASPGQKTALSDKALTIQNAGGSTYVDGGDILNVNQVTTGGYLNVTSKLLLSKPTLIDVINTYNANAGASAQLTYLAAAITRASTGSTNFTALFSGTDPYTLFAPNNAAFIDAGYATIAAVQAAAPDVLGNKLKYQMLQGAKLTTAFDSVAVKAYDGTNIYFDIAKNSANATTWYANGINFGNTGGNLIANNGVMHLVGRFFPVPVSVTTLDRISSDANLSSFYALIQRASTADPKFNFAAVLSSPTSSYTVYAVNNVGLTAAGYPNVAAINAEQPSVLASILKLHMVAKRIHNISVTEGGGITSLAGTSLTINTSGGYKVKGPSNASSIPVITGNIVTTNGLLNIIGTLLKP